MMKWIIILLGILLFCWVIVRAARAAIRFVFNGMDWIRLNALDFGIGVVTMMAAASITLGAIVGVVVGAFTLGFEIGTVAVLAVLIMPMLRML
jgi:hypothetical protein